MLSGQYPHRYGINRFLHAQNSSLELPLEVETFGEVAQSAGYATGFAGKWHVSTYVSPSGLDHPDLSTASGPELVAAEILALDQTPRPERSLRWKWRLLAGIGLFAPRLADRLLVRNLGGGWSVPR